MAGTHGFTVDWTPYPWGSDHYREHGSMMPPDALDQLRPYDALFFGAVGAPDVPDTVTLWGLLIPIRRAFDQYVNLRPVRHIEGVPSPLVRPDGIDLVVVRENSEGEYSDTGGRENRGPRTSTRCRRPALPGTVSSASPRYAAELAQRRSGRLTSATKSNGILHTMPYWDEVVAETAGRYPTCG